MYDPYIFNGILEGRFPDNTILSHDLLEGSIIKAGLASDVEVQDGFPNNYIAYMKRNHRWYRGDMQIIRWLLNPKSTLSILSKWKILFTCEKRTTTSLLLIFLSLHHVNKTTSKFIH